MNTELERIVAEALKLSIEERECLVDSLLASLDCAAERAESGPVFATPELERYWVEESHRRMKLIESGEMETYPAEEVFARLKEHLNRLRREPQGEEMLSIDVDCDASALPFSGFATPDIERAWIEECRRRFELMKSGEMATYPAEEVMAELMAEYKQ